jgi:hypothetical protein
MTGAGLRGAVPRLDAGIAMCNFALVAAELGLRGSWAAPDPAPGGRQPLLPPGSVRIASWFPA